MQRAAPIELYRLEAGKQPRRKTLHLGSTALQRVGALLNAHLSFAWAMSSPGLVLRCLGLSPHICCPLKITLETNSAQGLLNTLFLYCFFFFNPNFETNNIFLFLTQKMQKRQDRK